MSRQKPTIETVIVAIWIIGILVTIVLAVVAGTQKPSMTSEERARRDAKVESDRYSDYINEQMRDAEAEYKADRLMEREAERY